MAYYYSDRGRRHNPNAVPNIEVFAGSAWNCHQCENQDTYPLYTKPKGIPLCQVCGSPTDGEGGWFYAFGFPGCLWSSDPIGPFDTEAEALADAREGFED